MNPSLSRVIVVVFVSVASAQAIAGPITYSLVNYPDLQNGATLTGSITTDGQLGFPNILSWTFTITSTALGTFTASSSDAGASFHIDGPLTATASQITLPGPDIEFSFFQTNHLEFSTGLSGTGPGKLLVWDQTFNPDSLFSPEAVYEADTLFNGGIASTLFSDSYEGTPTFSLGGEPWIIAEANPTVDTPEPAALTLLGVGMAGYCWRRLFPRRPDELWQ
jgi:hypothetical protein